VFGLTALSSNYFKIEKKKRMKLVTDFENFGEFEKKKRILLKSSISNRKSKWLL